ncbi:MAG: O-antigen ligase family protein, partial [Undibacterium sp.]|nr:O-antigen ligase family protein [Undibacterium sp.]
MPSQRIFNFSLIIFALLYLGANLHSQHIHPFRTYYHEFLLVIAVFLGVGGLGFLSKRVVVFPKIAYLPLALIVVLLGQWQNGLVPSQNVYYPLMIFCTTLLAMVLGATWAVQVAGVEKICLMLAAVQLLAGLLSVLMQCTQILGLNLYPVVMYLAREGAMRPFANVAQPNQLALLLCFALASVWCLFQARRLRSGAAIALAVVLLWGLALTQSRIAWIILPVFAVLVCTPFLGQRPLSRWPVFLLLGAFAGVVLILPEIGQLLGFASASFGERMGGRSERMVLMQQAWAMAKQHPWFGVGWFGFGAEQVNIASQFRSTTYAEHSHNLVLNLMAELGLPIALLLLGGLVYWFYQTCWAKQAAQNNAVG